MTEMKQKTTPAFQRIDHQPIGGFAAQHAAPDVISVTGGGQMTGQKFDQTFNVSEVDVVSQITGSKSVMIRQRGRFPRTLWQRGALQTHKKKREKDSAGKSSM